MRTPLLLLFACLLGIVRFAISPSELSFSGTYQAVAHIFVGGLLGAWLASRQRAYLWIVLGLSVLEVIAAISARS